VTVLRRGARCGHKHLLRLLVAGQVDAARFITHGFGFEEFETAYDVFARAGEAGALKVVLTRES
jgi:alcohol dehydrogenase